MNDTLAQAIARQEGWYEKGAVPNRCQRNNNPGNLDYGPFTKGMGATGTDGRFAIFADAKDGWNALYALLILEYANLSISAAINKYAPNDENNTLAYIQNVCEFTGRKATDLVKDCLL